MASFLVAAALGAGAASPANLTCADNPPFLSYHIHVLYWQNSPQHVRGAMALQADAVKYFGFDLVPNCTDLFHNPQPCMFSPDWEPAGPFTTAQYSFWIPVEAIWKYVPFFMQRRGEYDVMVHPNSGCELEDHTLWPLWGGRSWELDGSIFSYHCPGCGVSAK